MTRTFFSASVALGSALELLLSPTTVYVVAGYYVKSTFCYNLLLLCRIRRGHLKNDNFLICGQLMSHTELFHFSNLLQMLNDHSLVNVEFFGNFLCSC